MLDDNPAGSSSYRAVSSEWKCLMCLIRGRQMVEKKVKNAVNEYISFLCLAFSNCELVNSMKGLLSQ